MLKYISLLFIVSAILFTSCGSVPVTGRKQMLLVSDQEVLTSSLKQYGEFIQSAPKSTDKKNTELVNKVGRNIANAVEAYLKKNGLEKEVSQFSWEFNLVKSNEVNAFCMPGGKIVVYEGILPYTKDETGLAVIIGHEVAHAVAKHANERMSQQTAANYGSTALSAVLGGSSEITKTVASTAFGLGTQYGLLLPYSRKHELEADELGLIFMAMAGYDPRAAVGFWERMSEKSGSNTSEFSSTHPSDAKRIKEIKEALPNALKYYNGGAGTGTTNTKNTKDAKTSEKWKF